MAKWDFGTESIKSEKKQKNVSGFIFKPFGVKRTYGVLLRSEDEKEKILQIHYEIDVICLDDNEDGDTHIFELYKHQVYIDEKKPDSTIDELIEKCGKVLYPLKIETNSSGRVISILNQKEIYERWVLEKGGVKQSYKGPEVDLLLKNMEEILSNNDKLTTLLLQRDWFMTLFFTSIYKSTYGNSESIDIPFIPYAPSISYAINQNVDKYPSKKENILITREGKCNDLRSESDMNRGNIISINNVKKAVKGTLNFNYQLYENSSIVDSITGSCDVVFPSGKSKRMMVEIYNLKEKEPKSAAEKVIEKEKEEAKIEQPKKKKKIYRLFGKELKFGK